MEGSDYRSFEDWYAYTLLEIQEGKHLKTHMADVTQSIKHFQDCIDECKDNGWPLHDFEETKNRLYYLKWLILEKS